MADENTELRDNPIDELKKAALEAEKDQGNTAEDLFVKLASEHIERNRPDIVEAIGRGASKVGDIGSLAASGLSGEAKAALAAIGGAGKGFTEAMNDKTKRNAEILKQLEDFKPKFSDPYAERKDKEMKIKILDKVADKATEYEKSETFKSMTEATTSYNQLAALVNDAAAGKGFSDIGILTKFMKSLDPRSVVRDTEFQTAANTGSLFQSLENKVKGLITGQKINDKQRNEILIAATAVMNANKENFGNYRNAQIAKAKQPLEYYKSIFPELDTEASRLFVDIGEFAKTQPKTQAVIKYKTPKGEYTEEEMKKFYFQKNPQATEDNFRKFLEKYSR